jgi:hypothetical protein
MINEFGRLCIEAVVTQFIAFTSANMAGVPAELGCGIL